MNTPFTEEEIELIHQTVNDLCTVKKFPSISEGTVKLVTDAMWLIYMANERIKDGQK